MQTDNSSHNAFMLCTSCNGHIGAVLVTHFKKKKNKH